MTPSTVRRQLLGILCVGISGTLVALGILTFAGGIPSFGRADRRIVPPPDRAVLVSPRGGVPNGAWVRAQGSRFRVTTPAGEPTRFHIQIQIDAVSRIGITSTRVASPIIDAASRPGSRQVALPLPALVGSVAYRWRARIVDEEGAAGAWAGSGRFRLADAPPAAPQIIATNLATSGWSRVQIPQFRWTVSAPQAPIAMYAVAFAPAGKSSAPSWREVRNPSVSLPGLADGRWRLIVQAIDATGARSPVTITTFSLARSAPAPRIAAAAPASGDGSNIQTPVVHLSAVPGVAPIRAFEYRVTPIVSAAQSLGLWTSSDATTIALPGLADGSWRVQMRSVDAAGNRSPPITWTFTLDRRPLDLRVLPPSSLHFTPPVERARISYTLSKPATVTFSVLRLRDLHSVQLGSLGLQDTGSSHVFTWDGRTSTGNLASAGTYILVIRAVDRAGNSTSQSSIPLTLEDQWIRVSLRTQTLTAYQGDRAVLTTPVTTGGPWTPTPPGTFHVLQKNQRWVFHSPWPKGSPLWYPDSPTNFALLYQVDGGWFLHDAPWRTNHGPGSNAVVGTPGGDFTGSHGCTNIPYASMAELFAWADVGTLVQIVR
jgi:hypothetical protein